jgi:hypothetical protein
MMPRAGVSAADRTQVDPRAIVTTTPKPIKIIRELRRSVV